MLVCDSEDDYGTVLIAVATSDGTVLGEYEVTVVYDGEDGFFVRKLKEFRNEFVNNFINDNRYLLLLRGLGNTLIITLCALLIGIVIGTLVAAVRSTYDKNAETYKLYKSVGGKIMKAVNALCKLYLTVIRGTPVVVQLMIMYFIIFAGGTSDLSVAIVAFGINSGAYVAEILRGGIMSVDAGQFEAGRSLGFNYVQTMIYIIIPQMFKSSLPALCNEFISLLKETSVAGYVPIMELTKAGDIIRGRTYSAFMPLIAVALIYLVIVVILTKLVGILERRLRKNER
ncbi:MAG: amino acid ABC transporter permease [Clostridia bacterium]|nr:amino acid ABC transporter permease [Clostridia bacterium]